MADKHKIGAGKSLSNNGILGPGTPIKKEDLKNPENWEALIEKGVIVAELNYVDNDDSKFKAPEVKKETKKPVKKTEKKASTGAQKK
jgi:hypothetical protein